MRKRPAAVIEVGLVVLLGNATTYSYTDHLLTSITDPLNNVVLRNTYQGAVVATQQDAANGQYTFAYSTPGVGATRVTDPRNKMQTFYFDTQLRVTDVLDAYSQRVSVTRDAANNLMGASNPVPAATGARRLVHEVYDGRPTSESGAGG